MSRSCDGAGEPLVLRNVFGGDHGLSIAIVTLLRVGEAETFPDSCQAAFAHMPVRIVVADQEAFLSFAVEEVGDIHCAM
jgi:hypothetical protein